MDDSVNNFFDKSKTQQGISVQVLYFSDEVSVYMKFFLTWSFIYKHETKYLEIYRFKDIIVK